MTSMAARSIKADIAKWGASISGLNGGRDAYVYFKHEEQGKGPEFARMLIE